MTWTLTLTDATGQTTTLDSRAPLSDIRRLLSGSTIDRADCLIIDDPAPRPKVPHVDLLKTPGSVSTWSRPAETERKPRAQERAYWKRVRRRMRNLCDREREKMGRADQAWDQKRYAAELRFRRIAPTVSLLGGIAAVLAPVGAT